jgi:hypothetical protein
LLQDENNSMNRKSNLLCDLTNWFQKQGCRVVLSKSSGWVEFATGVFQAFPYHWVISPSEEEILNMLNTNRLIALRYSTPLASSCGQVSYHVVYEKSSYPLSSLHKKVRHDIAKGLKYATYEPVPVRRLAFEGWELQHDTLVRQGRQNAQTRETWERTCIAAEGIPGFQSWGAIHNGELVATLLSFTQEDTVCIFFQQSKTDHIRFGVNNALTYVFTQESLQRPGIQCIFYGLHSLDAPPTVDQFKIRMGYTAKAVRQRIVFHPNLQPFINPVSYSIIQKIRYLRPNSYTLSKAEGAFRFYLQGKLSLSRQKWPEVLEEQKIELLC